MKDIIIIKLFRNPIYEKVYRGYAVSTYPKIVEEMKDFAIKNGKTLYFNLITGEIVQGNPICEIDYTNYLSKEELDFYTDKVKYLSSEGEIFCANKVQYTKQETTLCLIKLNKINSENLIEFTPQEKLPTKVERFD